MPNSIDISNNVQKDVKVLFGHPLSCINQWGLDLVKLFGIKGSQTTSDFLYLFLYAFPGVFDDFADHVIVWVGITT